MLCIGSIEFEICTYIAAWHSQQTFQIDLTIFEILKLVLTRSVCLLQSIAKRTEDDAVLSVQTEDGGLIEAQASECCLQNERDDTVDDLVRSDFLHEPG